MTTLIRDLRPEISYDVLCYSWSGVNTSLHTIISPGIFVRQRLDIADWNNAALEFRDINDTSHIFRARQIHVFKESTAHYKQLMVKAETRMNTCIKSGGPSLKEEICMAALHPNRISAWISF